MIKLSPQQLTFQAFYKIQIQTDDNKTADGDANDCRMIHADDNTWSPGIVDM